MIFLLNYYPSSPGYTSGAIYNIYSIIILILLFIYLILNALKKSIKLKLAPLSNIIFIFLLILIVIITLNSILQPTFEGANQSIWIFTVLIILVLYYSTFKFDFYRDFNYIAMSVIFFGLVSVFLALYVRFVGEVDFDIIYIRYFESHPRLKGLFASPIGFSSFNAIAIIFTSYLLFKKRTFLNTFIIFVLVFSILLGASRGPIISLLVAVITIFLIRSIIQKSNRQKYRTFFHLFILSLIAIFFISILYDNFEYYISNILRFDRDYDPRFDIWSTGIQLYFRQPVINQLLGAGSGSFFRNVGFSPDNLYIRLLVDYGLISLVIFLMMNILIIISMIKYSLKERNFEVTTNITLLIFLLIRQTTNQNLFTVSIDTILYFYILISYLYLVSRIKSKKNNSRK
jgi:O-antigen ligase